VHPKGAYFTRGSGHDKLGRYTEMPEQYQEVVDRLVRKHKNAALAAPQPVIERRPGARLGLVTLGGCDGGALEAIAALAEKGTAVDYLRVRAFPFAPSVEEFLREHDTNFVVEQNRDGQLAMLLLAETGVERVRLRSLLAYGGFPLSSHQVVEGVERHMEKRS
jgi:2-oxoglutarate ferredoxin oxidoreductase subunit alpha